MKQELLDSLKLTTNDLLTTISLFTQEQFNKVPFEGSWTAGQVTEHLFKAESGVPTVWQGNTKKTERKIDERTPLIESIFLDFTIKMKSPDFILPSEGPHSKVQLYNALKANRLEIEQLASVIDESLTFVDFPLPGIGELTGKEWAAFIISHSKRHIWQMKNIYKIVGEQ
ncbi:DinB family protein [Chitinophagaceae bacterium LWZ2-11]